MVQALKGRAGACTVDITPSRLGSWGRRPPVRNEAEDSDLLAHAVVFTGLGSCLGAFHESKIPNSQESTTYDTMAAADEGGYSGAPVPILNEAPTSSNRRDAPG